MKNRQELLYLLYGVLTTVINIFSYGFLTKALRVNYKTATLMAWLIAVIFAYFTNKKYVFKSQKKTLVDNMKELLTFFVFRIFSVIVDFFCMIFFVEGLKINDLISKVLTNILVVIFNFLVSKFIIFKQTPSSGL